MCLLPALNDGAEALKFNSAITLTMSPREYINVNLYFYAEKPPHSEFLRSTFPLFWVHSSEIFSLQWKKKKISMLIHFFRPKRNKPQCLSSL